MVGQTLESAQKELKNKDYRIVRVDNIPRVVTCDYKPERLNLIIKNNIIIDVYNG